MTATAPVADTMTAEQFMAMTPKKGYEQWLFQGRVEEAKMSRRNRDHCLAIANVTRILSNWAIQDPANRGTVYTSDVYFRVRLNPVTTYGIDATLASPEQHKNRSGGSGFIEGVPPVAIEVLSPSDSIKRINDKLMELLDCGTPVVWIVDPFQKTVSIHRKGQIAPTLLNVLQELTCEPELPGFRCRVAELFE